MMVDAKDVGPALKQRQSHSDTLITLLMFFVIPSKIRTQDKLAFVRSLEYRIISG